LEIFSRNLFQITTGNTIRQRLDAFSPIAALSVQALVKFRLRSGPQATL
jgi:hypothetical protein